MNWWKKQIGYYLLSEITPSINAKQRDHLLREKTRRGETRNPSTVVRYLAALSHAFRIAIKEWAQNGNLKESGILLLEVVENAYIEGVVFLLNNGTNPLHSVDGVSPIELAVNKGYFDITDLFFESLVNLH